MGDGFKRGAETETFKSLFDKMRHGDGDATSILHECMDVWSAAIVNYIHAYDPQLVVMGGGIMGSADVILPYVRQKVSSLAWQPREKTRIVASELGDYAALTATEYYFRR